MKADYKGGIPPAAHQERYNPYGSGTSPSGEPVCGYRCSADEFKAAGYQKDPEPAPELEPLPEGPDGPGGGPISGRPWPQPVWFPRRDGSES